MSNLFNLSRILTENTSMNDLLTSFSPMTFLSEGVSILREQGETEFKLLDSMYSNVLEAESKAEENKAFSVYFKEYKNTIEKYILKMNELRSKFNITVENFADANKDIMDSDDNANILSASRYIGVQYQNLLDKDIPNVEPYKVFKKEFAFIGKLLQDLGPDVKEDVKAQVIATVCNNLKKDIDDDWLDKIAEKIADCDECSKDGFAKTIYNRFIANPKAEMDIDIGTVKQAKLSIMNYTNFINVINKSVDDFCDGLEKIADETGAMFFRNKDHKLPISTDVDGVEDRTYRLGDYSMNQVNMFISTKISQINEICNLYLIAISIKMDCIIKYLQQCKDIINTASSGVDSTPNNEVDPGNTDDDNDGIADDNEPESIEDDEDKTENDGEEDPESEDDNENIDDDIETSPKPDGDDHVVQDNSENEIEQECYLFDAMILEAERYINHLALIDKYAKVSTNEAVDPNAIKKAVSSKIDFIIQKIKSILEKVRNALKLNYKPIIDAVDKNKAKILKAKVPSEWTMKKIDTKPLLNFNIARHKPDFDYSKPSEWMPKEYSSICEKTQNESQNPKDMILAKLYTDREETYTASDFRDSVEFISSGYEKIVSACDKAVTELNNEKDRIAREQASKPDAKTSEADNKEDQKESAFLNDIYKTYFSEDSMPGSVEKSEESKKFDNGGDYCKNTANLITAVININNMALKKHINFVRKLASSVGVKLPMPALGANKK